MLNYINIEDIKDIAIKASVEVMKIYNTDFEVEYKEDSSPLTLADKKANDIICSTLQKLYPNIPILSEENKLVDYDTRKDWEYFWCIDPIDGTKEFVKKNGEFTINIALIFKDTPVLGVVYAPVIDKMYYAKKDCGAFCNDTKLPIKINNNQKEKMFVVTSHTFSGGDTKKYIDSLDTKEVQTVSIGSSLKLCLVAEGTADIYPRLGPTSEWDTAAADAIVRESGKMVYQYDNNQPFIYNKKNLLNPFFIVK
jgi:3'(2'), 5'-bisphosphate nucleotidase